MKTKSMRHEGGFSLLCLVEVAVPPHSLLPSLQGDGEEAEALRGKKSEAVTEFYGRLLGLLVVAD